MKKPMGMTITYQQLTDLTERESVMVDGERFARTWRGKADGINCAAVYGKRSIGRNGE